MPIVCPVGAMGQPWVSQEATVVNEKPVQSPFYTSQESKPTTGEVGTQANIHLQKQEHSFFQLGTDRSHQPMKHLPLHTNFFKKLGH